MEAINATIRKFGYPATLLREYDHWVVLLRPEQVTAGCMVLACKRSATSLPEVSPEAFAELPKVTGELEAALDRAFGKEKINYLLFMMVDKEVHFHVVPRYSETQSLGAATFPDPGWPRQPEMGSVIPLSEEEFAALQQHLFESW